MNVIVRASLLVSAALCSAPLLAQTAPLVIGQPAAEANTPVLREGTEIRLATITELGSKHSKVGQRFDLEVTDPVMLEGQVVIPAGARAVGEVTRVKKKGMWGKSGKVDVQLLYVKVGDRQVRITGNADDKGKAGTAGVVASLVVIPVAGFFVTGTSAVIPPRTPVTGYLDEDIPVVFAGKPTGPAPVVIPAAEPVPAVAVTQAAAPAPDADE